MEEWALPTPIRLKIAQMAHLMDVEQTICKMYGRTWYGISYNDSAYYRHARHHIWNKRARVATDCNCWDCVCQNGCECGECVNE